jgi:hypothetical protein
MFSTSNNGSLYQIDSKFRVMLKDGNRINTLALKKRRTFEKEESESHCVDIVVKMIAFHHFDV